MKYAVILITLIVSISFWGCAPRTGSVAEIMIVSTQADSIALKPTERVSANVVVNLEQGESIKFFDASGKLYSLSGPYNGSLKDQFSFSVPTTQGREMLKSLTEFINPAETPYHVPGVTRGDDDQKLWDLVLLNISEETVFCVQENTLFNVTRKVSGFDSGANLELKKEGKTVQSIKFNPNQDSVEVASEDIPSGEVELFMNDEKINTLNIRLLPQFEYSLHTVSLHSYGCMQQFVKIIDSLSKELLSD